eukprot:3797458-Pyramimonas_sp.AAC.3
MSLRLGCGFNCSQPHGDVAPATGAPFVQNPPNRPNHGSKHRPRLGTQGTQSSGGYSRESRSGATGSRAMTPGNDRRKEDGRQTAASAISLWEEGEDKGDGASVRAPAPLGKTRLYDDK